MPSLAILLSAVSWFALTPQEPLRLLVIATDSQDSGDVVFLRGVRRAIEAQNHKGGVDGAKVELVIAPAATPAEVAAVVTKSAADGVGGVVAPPAAWLADAARKACTGKLPCVSFATSSAAVVPVFDRLVGQTFCMTRVGLVRDKHKDAVEIGKLLAKGLTAPVSLLWEMDITGGTKAFTKLIEKERPEVLLFDAEPPAVEQFVRQALGPAPPVLVLTPRAHGEATRTLPMRTFFVQGLTPAAVPTTSQFRADYERDHGVPGFAAAEGYEGAMALMAAIDAANARDVASVQAALSGLTLEGVRGRYGFDKALAAFAPPLGVWLAAARPSPYVPLVVPLQAVGASPGTAVSEAKKPQEAIGEPFGKWRTAKFRPEEGAQVVLCSWADDGGFATAAEDLKLLGLATGTDALVDHLVREEIMARVMAIASTKYGRNEDGTGIAGKSLRIAFAMHMAQKEREKKKLRLWPARFGGDHADAGGEAFGTFCRVYTMFIRRTIFQKHALQPPLAADDLAYLDGTYVFGSNLDQDKRSELIRALVNSYAGSMALTLAHEVGHLAGLGHVTDDPVEIMNVNEGDGLDYREARFGQPSFESMRSRYGLVGDKPGKGEKGKN